MAPKVCMTKLKKEMKAFLNSPPPHIPAIHVNERNMLEWHFLLEGPPETPYAGGWYIGKLRFPPEYPFAPPAIMVLTPSGRFAPGTRLCLSMSDFHPESWNPMWTVSSILTGLLSFMVEDQITTGSLKTTDAAKQQFAAASLQYNLQHTQLKAMFQKELQAATAGSSTAANESSATSSTQPPADSIAQADDQPQSSCQPETLALSHQQSAADADRAGQAPTNSIAAMALHDVGAQASDQLMQTHQSDFLDRMYQLMMEGQPQCALAQMEDELKLELPLDQYYGSLLLLKAQASAMIGNVAAADEAVQAWQDVPSIQLGSLPPTLTIPSRCKSMPSCWRASWLASAAAKDKGNDLFQKRDFAGALQAYEQSLSAAPECSTVHCNKAAALAKLEQHNDAIVAARQALKINSEYEKARKRMNDSKTALRQQ